MKRGRKDQAAEMSSMNSNHGWPSWKFSATSAGKSASPGGCRKTFRVRRKSEKRPLRSLKIQMKRGFFSTRPAWDPRGSQEIQQGEEATSLNFHVWEKPAAYSRSSRWPYPWNKIESTATAQEKKTFRKRPIKMEAMNRRSERAQELRYCIWHTRTHFPCNELWKNK